jgi:chromosome segregation ATPase
MLKNILIAFLITLTAFSVFKYIAALKEKGDLLHSLKQTEEKAAILEKERQKLLQGLEKEKELVKQLDSKISALKDYLKASKKRLTKLFTDFEEAQMEIRDLDSRFSILKAENIALIEEKQQVFQENESLKAKLNSITELKRALIELKRQVRRVSGNIKQKAQPVKIREGSRGYLSKEGKFTLRGKVKIQVIPVPSIEQ